MTKIEQNAFKSHDNYSKFIKTRSKPNFIRIYLKSKPNFTRFGRFILLVLAVLFVLLVLAVLFHMKIIHVLLKSMKFHQNPSIFNEHHTTSHKHQSNQCKSIKINPNHTYMHDNLQHKRKNKSNSLLHVLGLLVSHV